MTILSLEVRPSTLRLFRELARPGIPTTAALLRIREMDWVDFALFLQVAHAVDLGIDCELFTSQGDGSGFGRVVADTEQFPAQNFDF